MKLQAHISQIITGKRPVALFSIIAAGALSALVAAASIYLFLGAGRAQLPVPVLGEILAPAPVGALPAGPPPIQVPPPVETPAPDTLIAGPFIAAATPASITLGNAQLSASPAPAGVLDAAGFDAGSQARGGDESVSGLVETGVSASGSDDDDDKDADHQKDRKEKGSGHGDKKGDGHDSGGGKHDD